MKIRKLVAAALVGSALVVGAQGVAGAAPSPSGSRACQVAQQRLSVLEARQSKLQTQLSTVQSALDRAQSSGRQVVIHRLQVRIANLELVLGKVGSALETIHQKCG